MSTNYKIILFYDISTKNKIEKKNHQKFNKYIKSIGFIMLQESVYVKSAKSKANYEIIKRDLRLISPEVSNIRSIILTEKVFENLDLISGEQLFNEKIISKKTRIIEL